MEAAPAIGNQVQNKSETTSVTLSMRRSRAKKIVQEMEAAPATGKQVQNKLETTAIPRLGCTKLMTFYKFQGAVVFSHDQ